MSQAWAVLKIKKLDSPDKFGKVGRYAMDTSGWPNYFN